MAIKTAPLSRFLCLEVWLGPMEGTRFCAPAAPDALVRIGRRRGDEKRGVTNDLVLAQAEGVSGFHAELRSRGGTLLLRDLNSTNGTFAAGHRISGEVQIAPDETFVLSTTLVHVTWRDDVPVSAVPSEDELASSIPFQPLLSTAARAAVRRSEPYVDTRHLTDALIHARDESIAASFSAAGLSADGALSELWQGEFLPEPLHWLRRFVTLPEGAPPPAGAKPFLSPAVRALFGAAVARLSGYADSEAKQLAARSLFVQLAASRGPVAAWLAARKVRAEAVPASRRAGVRKTTRAAGPRAPAPVATPDDATMRQAMPPPRDETAAERTPRPVKSPDASGTKRFPRLTGEGPAPPEGISVPTTGDAVLDQRARAIAAELEEAASLYRFSTPEDRRAVMRTLVSRSLSAIAPQNRARILSQIRFQFPVTAPPPAEASEETVRLRARVRELEKRLADLSAERERRPEPRRDAGSDSGWRGILAPAGTAPSSAELEAMRATVSFARNLEKFLLGMVQTSMTPGDATMSFRLPGYRYTLDTVLQALVEGKAVGLEGLPDYLRELERWQVAILAAHHASPRIWFDRLWKKINPAVIEGSVGKSPGWKIGGQAGDWWNRYKELVRGLNPDVVQDQVLQTATKTAQEEYEKLSKPKK